MEEEEVEEEEETEEPGEELETISAEKGEGKSVSILDKLSLLLLLLLWAVVVSTERMPKNAGDERL